MTDARSVREWIGETPDSRPPPRVRIRVFEKFGKRCAGCGRPIRGGDGWDLDHIIAMINGGQNRESNLQPLCEWCHPDKTKADVAEKSDVYQRKRSHFGQKPKSPWTIPGSKRSGWHRPLDPRKKPHRRRPTTGESE